MMTRKARKSKHCVLIKVQKMAQEVLKELDCSIFNYFGHTQRLPWNWRKPAKSSLLTEIEKHQKDN